MGGCSGKNNPKMKIYIEHSTEQNIIEAYNLTNLQINQQLKIQVSEQIKSNQSNIFTVYVINPGHNREQVWSIQQGDELISQYNIKDLIEKIKDLSQK
ncbi:hypothetical protein TTHERM_00338450 (macronuclear) [Tetrahymena thermophila SB210]|uniref:Uncharacterized protein n=1 Tax=Tetrahymena thermophila (strain SB210) TaxID=312017 RepID=I7MEQ4_TETTS|nr:hypothetical protein TTHERM_00338450 [Tetrahymena thermophila SB210]EAR97363.1 hypothetical protein TTHERM_00338450 [Tetrahymena thermophila SB210]|eukprot:XP_001017608.1 hypothetical protein TTHERM_00338450 [Tetrahymena thermophila SB210]